MSDIIRTAAWQKLKAAARDATLIDTKETAQALSDAAKQWGDLARGPVLKPVEVRGTNGNTLRSGHLVPFGRTKGMPIEEAEEKDLRWLAGALEESVNDSSKERWREKNQALLDAIHKEIESR